MIKLKKSIDALIKKNTNKMFVFGVLDYKWKEIVGKEVYNQTQLIKIEKKTLYIKCFSPVWKSELQFQKKEIILKINKETKNIENLIII